MELQRIGYINRKRKFGAVRELFHRALMNPPEQLLEQKIREKGRCTVFEIGSGYGSALTGILEFERLRELGNRLELIGMDLVANEEKEPRKPLHIKGNALIDPFPKADMIFSVWSIGYMGNVGYLVKKTANALNPKGIAVLHVNALGLVASKPIIKDTKKLAVQLAGLRIPGCKLEVHRGFMLEDFLLDNDLIVTIEKQ